MHVDEHTIELDGEPVFFRSAGSIPAESGTTAVYLHGVPTSSEDWCDFLERTGGLAPDLRGFGRSGKGGHQPYSLDAYADFVERLLAERGVGPIHLIGHGWGAAAGLRLAERNPARIAKLVLIDAVPLLPGFRWPAPVRIWRRRLVGELLMGAATRGLMARALRRGSVDGARAWPPDRVARIWAQFDVGTQRALLRVHRETGGAELAAAGSALATLDCPALVLWGQRDPWLDPSWAANYAEHLPQATAELVPDAGHWPWLDRPEVVDRVAEFLA